MTFLWRKLSLVVFRVFRMACKTLKLLLLLSSCQNEGLASNYLDRHAVKHVIPTMQNTETLRGMVNTLSGWSSCCCITDKMIEIKIVIKIKWDTQNIEISRDYCSKHYSETNNMNDIRHAKNLNLKPSFGPLTLREALT